MRTSLKSALVLAAAAAFAAPARAQITDDIDATATVLQALTVTGDAALAFGNIAPSQVKTVAAGNPSGGHFSIRGAPGSSGSFGFNCLPASLQMAGPALPPWPGLHRSSTALGGPAGSTPPAAGAQTA